MELVVGTYEELLLGYKLKDENETKEFENSFTDHSHMGSVRSVAISKTGFLVSGSSDETISLFNLKKRAQLGSLMHHEGSITSLSFYGKTHMFSTSEDGTIGVWRVGSWKCHRTFRGHKGAVHSVSVHPSGKLALSVGKDKTLRTWNLITGRSAYVTNIKQVADQVLWSPTGDSYVVVIGNQIDVYSVKTSAIEHSISCPNRIASAIFVQNDILAVGGESGMIYLYDVQAKTTALQIATDTNRVKGITCCQCPDDPEAKWLASASSDGKIKLWQLNCPQEGGTWTSKLVAGIDTKFRLTCLAIRQVTASVSETEPKRASDEATAKHKTRKPKQTHEERTQHETIKPRGRSKERKRNPEKDTLKKRKRPTPTEAVTNKKQKLKKTTKKQTNIS